MDIEKYKMIVQSLTIEQLEMFSFMLSIIRVNQNKIALLNEKFENLQKRIMINESSN